MTDETAHKLKRLLCRRWPSALFGIATFLVVLSHPIVTYAQLPPDIRIMRDLLADGGPAPFKKICLLRIDAATVPCNEAMYIEYKDGDYVIQFNRRTKEQPVVSFSGTLATPDSISISDASLRLGNQSVPFEDIKAQGECVLGSQAAACIGRLSDGRLIVAQIFRPER